jgi:Fe2+ transport system protein B
MASSALLLGFSGLLLTFFPEELAEFIGNSGDGMMVVTLQVIGAMYLAFGMLNWMARKSLIGGIYNRPIAIANMTHFMMVGITLTKLMIGSSELPQGFWFVVAVYLFFAVVFIRILFTTPRIRSSQGVPHKRDEPVR